MAHDRQYPHDDSEREDTDSTPPATRKEPTTPPLPGMEPVAARPNPIAEFVRLVNAIEGAGFNQAQGGELANFKDWQLLRGMLRDLPHRCFCAGFLRGHANGLTNGVQTADRAWAEYLRNPASGFEPIAKGHK